MALTGMMQTNKNVDLFQITAIGSEDLFVGEENQLCLTVKNKDPKLILWGIEVQFADKLQNAEKITLEEVKYERQQFMAWNPARRGKQALPRLLIESRFPFKMLRAWKYYDQNMTVLIYPRRKGIERVPVVDGKPDDQEKNARAHDEGLFRDFREFQKSDPPQRIDWKRSLKHQKHLVKNFEASGEKRVLLDWDMTAFIPEFEDRISQLVFWIELCKKKNELFALKLKDDQTEYAGTETHRKACLEKLALLQIEDVA